MGFFRWVSSTLIAIAAVLIAVSNMQFVDLYFSPLHAPISIPLAIVFLGALGAGILIGGFTIWCEYGPLSKRADKKRAQVYGLLKDIDSIKKDQDMKEKISKPLLASPD